MAFYLQGIQFYESEYIMPQHLGRLASLSSSANLRHPKIDRTCKEQESDSWYIHHGFIPSQFVLYGVTGNLKQL